MTPRFLLQAGRRLLAVPGKQKSVEPESGRRSHHSLGFGPRSRAEAVIDGRDGKTGKRCARSSSRSGAGGGEMHQSDRIGASRNGQRESVDLGQRAEQIHRLGVPQRVGVAHWDVACRGAGHRLGGPDQQRERLSSRSTPARTSGEAVGYLRSTSW